MAVIPAKVPASPQLRRIVIVRNGGNVVTASCWCGKALRLELVNINVFVRAFNSWLEEHSRCEPKGQPKPKEQQSA